MKTQAVNEPCVAVCFVAARKMLDDKGHLEGVLIMRRPTEKARVAGHLEGRSR